MGQKMKKRGRSKLTRKEIVIRQIQKDLVEAFEWKIPRNKRKNFERASKKQLLPMLDEEFLRLLKEIPPQYSTDELTQEKHQLPQHPQHPYYETIEANKKLWEKLADKIEDILWAKNTEKLEKYLEVEVASIPSTPHGIRLLAESIAGWWYFCFFKKAKVVGSINEKKFFRGLSRLWVELKINTLSMDDVQTILKIFDEPLTEHNTGRHITHEEREDIKITVEKLIKNFIAFATG